MPFVSRNADAEGGDSKHGVRNEASPGRRLRTPLGCDHRIPHMEWAGSGSGSELGMGLGMSNRRFGSKLIHKSDGFHRVAIGMGSEIMGELWKNVWTCVTRNVVKRPRFPF